MAIPGVGPVVAAGWLVATLTGAAAGGATGGIIGALSQQAGLSKEESEVYAEGLRRGGAIVSARVEQEDAARLQGLMDRSAVKIADRANAYRKSGWSTYDPNAKPYTADEIERERSLYRRCVTQGTATIRLWLKQWERSNEPRFSIHDCPSRTARNRGLPEQGQDRRNAGGKGSARPELPGKRASVACSAS